MSVPTAVGPPHDWTRASKGEIVAEIARLIEVTPPPMSTGSSAPRQIFAAINDRLGLQLETQMTKPDLAKGIVLASGAAWHPDYESRGATVTKGGLVAVLHAVQFFTAD